MAAAVAEAVVIVVGLVIGGAAVESGKRPRRNEDEGDVVAGAPPGGNRGGGFEMIPPLLIPFAFLKSLENIGTNHYNDNQDNDNQDCELFPYSERDEKCKGKNAHHVIPDHCWRTTPGVGAKLLAMIAPDTEAAIAKATGQYYYPVQEDPISKQETGMDRDSGLCICVSGEGKTLKHGAIHAIFDDAEKALGQKGNPQWTAKLDDMENEAVKAIATVTGCDPAAMKRRLREYHNSRRLKEDPNDPRAGDTTDTMVRADPSGRNTGVGKGDPVINHRSGGYGI